MSGKYVRAGVIGLGVGRTHMDGYIKCPDARLVAVCDTNAVRLNELAQEFGIPPDARFTDYGEMLAQTNLDLVSVCLPNALHAEASIAALQAGAHVICEKPMAPTTAQAQQMLDAARRTGRRLMVMYNNRFRPDAQWIYSAVRNGRLGAIYHANIWWRRETGIPGWGAFGSRHLSGGGALIDIGVHALDLALWLLDFPQVHTVSGQTRALFGPRGRKTWGRPNLEPQGGFDVEDGAVGFLRLAGGVTVMLQATWAEHTIPGEDHLRIELQGTEGTAVLSVPNYTRDDTVRFYTEIEGAPVTVIPSLPWGAGAYSHAGFIHAAVAGLLNGGSLPSQDSEGLLSVRVLEALYNSAAAGREIVLAQETALGR